MKNSIKWTRKKFKTIWIRLALYTRRPIWKYLLKYKKIKRKFRWLRRYRFHRVAWNIWQNRRVCKFLFKALPCYKKVSQANSRRLGYYTNLQKLWWSVFFRARFWQGVKHKWSIHFRGKRKRFFTGVTFWRFKGVRFRRFLRKKFWMKVRKRWLWHRLIKFSVRTKFLSRIKRHFAYNIAIRKYFNKIVPYKYYKYAPFHRAPDFLVNNKLVPHLKKAQKLCNWGRVVVNGWPVNEHYIMKPFDLVTFAFRKASFHYKQKRFRHKRKRGVRWKVRKGFIYNRPMRMYILYKNIPYVRSKKRQAYLSYYYFHRNLMQGCRMR